MSQADFEWLQQQVRPVMVDDTIAQLPDLSPGWQSRLSGSHPKPSTPPRQTPEVLSMASFEPLPPPLLHASESPASRPEAPKIAPSPQPEASGSRHDDQGVKVGSRHGNGGNVGNGTRWI